MRLGHLGVAVLALCLCARAATAETSTPVVEPGFVETLDACIGRLPAASPADETEAVHDLRAACAPLSEYLARVDDADWRASVDPSRASRAELEDLRAFAEDFSYGPLSAQVPQLRVSDLQAILAGMQVDEPSGVSWWEKFVAWLRELFRSQDSEDPGWFFDWLEDFHLPDWVGEFVVDASIVLILVIAIVVVGNELRILGWFRRRDTWSERHRRPKTRPSPSDRAPETLEDLQGLPLKAYAGAVLSLVIRRLSRLELVSPATSYTNRELLSQLSDSEVAERFRSLVATVEPIVYGDGDPGPKGRARLLEAARALLTNAGRAAANDRVLHG